MAKQSSYIRNLAVHAWAKISGTAPLTYPVNTPFSCTFSLFSDVPFNIFPLDDLKNTEQKIFNSIYFNKKFKISIS